MLEIIKYSEHFQIFCQKIFFKETEKQRQGYSCVLNQYISHQHLCKITIWYSEMFLLVTVLVLLYFLLFQNGLMANWSMTFQNI